MRFLLSTLLLLNLGSVLVGCSSGDSNPVQTGIDNQVLHRGNADEISALDPHITTGMPEYRIQMAIFEGLVSKSGKTLEPVPGVAERWEVSEDATRFTFYLRDNAKWSDGTALTAKDCAVLAASIAAGARQPIRLFDVCDQKRRGFP